MLHTVDVVLRSHDSACTTCKDHTIMCTGSHDFVQRSRDFVCNGHMIRVTRLYVYRMQALTCCYSTFTSLTCYMYLHLLNMLPPPP